jgi:hypothetical protein
MSDTSVRDGSPSLNGTNCDAKGRDQRGRFARGNGGGPGNPFGRQVAAFRAALIAAVTPEDIQRVMKALVQQAVKGNVAAARLLLAYTVGKPADPANSDRVDVEEWQLVQQTVARPEVAQTLTNMPVHLASKLASNQLAQLRAPGAHGFGVPDGDAPRSANGLPCVAPSIPAAAPVEEIGQGKAATHGGAAPSISGLNGGEAPSPAGTNGPAAPSRVLAPSAAPSSIGNRGLTPLDSPDLATVRLLACRAGA